VPGTWPRPRSNRTLSLLQRSRLQPIELVDGLVHLLRRRPWNAAPRSRPRTPYGGAGYSQPQMRRGLRVHRSTHSRCSPGPSRSLLAAGNGLGCSTCVG
jgi:hypothetical protein